MQRQVRLGCLPTRNETGSSRRGRVVSAGPRREGATQLADVPASSGARYGRPPGSGDQPTRQQPQYQPTQYQPPPVPQRQAGAGYPPPAPQGRQGRQDDGWDAPTQHVSSSAYAGS